MNGYKKKYENDIKAIKKIIANKYHEREKILLDALDQDLDEESNSCVCNQTAIDDLKNEVAKYAQKLADLCSIVANDKVIYRQKEFLSYLVRNISEANLETEAKWMETLHVCLNDYFNFIEKESFAEAIAVYHGARDANIDTDKVNYKLVATNSKQWNLKLFSENRPEETKFITYTPPHYTKTPHFLVTTLTDKKKKHFYVFRFVHRGFESSGAVYTIIVLQCRDELPDKLVGFHKEFCDTLCRQKTIIRLLLRQSHDYKKFYLHVTDSRHKLLTSMQQVTFNIDKYLRKTKNEKQSKPLLPVDKYIKQSVKDLHSLITEIKSPDQLERNNYHEYTDLFSAVSEQVNLFQAVAERKGFNIDSRQLPIYEVLIKCNPADFTSAIAGIIENAIKYSYHKTKDIIVSGWLQDKEAFVQVKNYGIGIPHEKLEEIKTRNVRGEVKDSRELREGTGLGLAIATNFFCNILHGDLDIESKPAHKEIYEGTESYHRHIITVTITIPVEL